VKKLIRMALLIAAFYALIVALLAPGISERYLEHGQWLTGVYYGALCGIATFVLYFMEGWLTSRAKAAEPETDEARGARILKTAMQYGSDTLNQDDYGYLMAHVAQLGEQSREAQRAHRAAVTAYARHSKDTPVIYAPGEPPLVKKNSLTPFVEHA